MTIRAIDCTCISAAERAAVTRIFAASFAAGANPERALDRYLHGVERLFLAEQDGEIVGFQFYQHRRVDGRDIHHLSLAGRLPARARGMQARVGRALIRQASHRCLLLKPVYLASVCNSPASYANLQAVSPRCYPDVRRPAAGNPFGTWFDRVAGELGLRPDSRGLLPERMRQIGFALRSERGAAHPLAAPYDAYVNGDRTNGLFTLVEVYPLVHLPLYLARQALGRGGRKRTVALERRAA